MIKNTKQENVNVEYGDKTVSKCCLITQAITVRVTPSIKSTSTHLYTWVKRGTVSVTCLAQENNAITQARAQTQTSLTRVQHTNH